MDIISYLIGKKHGRAEGGNSSGGGKILIFQTVTADEIQTLPQLPTELTNGAIFCKTSDSVLTADELGRCCYAKHDSISPSSNLVYCTWDGMEVRTDPDAGIVMMLQANSNTTLAVIISQSSAEIMAALGFTIEPGIYVEGSALASTKPPFLIYNL